MFKQKTAYEMRISDWSSDVCSSDRWPKPPSSGRPDRCPGAGSDVDPDLHRQRESGPSGVRTHRQAVSDETGEASGDAGEVDGVEGRPVVGVDCLVAEVHRVPVEPDVHDVAAALDDLHVADVVAGDRKSVV